TTDGIRDLPGNDDPTGHHSHGTTTPIPDQRKRVDHVRKDNSFLAPALEACCVTWPSAPATPDPFADT
ncbi:hypothetical protein, partial [Streptomyces lancefieldiae]